MKIRMIIVLLSFTSVLACNGGGSSNGIATFLSSFPKSTSSGALSNNLRISLTDAPSRELKHVYVNIDHVELFVRKGNTSGRIVVAQNLGMVDLMNLRNGVLLPMEDLTLSSGTEISALRLVLKAEDNHSIKSDDSRCEMKTPSGQQAGIKIQLAKSFMIEDNYLYSMVMDFDAEKSVVITGNGDCLLKPVLKLMNVMRAEIKIPKDETAINECADPEESVHKLGKNHHKDDNNDEDNDEDSNVNEITDHEDHDNQKCIANNNDGSTPSTSPPPTTTTPIDTQLPTDPTSSPVTVNDPIVSIQPITSGTDTNVGGNFEIPMDPTTEPAVIPAL